ncbi:ATPase [Methanocella sp. CWC-04]|uniref:ATPase n=1 Tax=Methanooceanicella nereidis TaxID=2052831 RepID=A0AAP2RGF0_9EURY|nr:ATP-binding protein [Methanocella sp. CWC-04]MCD1295787.1 ATPase [Methanocella sp. CWC-04]
MKGSVGIIFGETGSHEFKFLVSNPAEVKRTDYVKVWHATDGWVLGQVLTMTHTSDLYGLETVANPGNTRVSRGNDKIVAKATVIGVRDDQGLLRTPKTPFCPGDKVFIADEELIINILGLSSGGAYLGLLDGTEIPVMVDRNKMVQKHCSILAMTGSGKSYTAAVIMEEMLEKGVPLLIIDPHGEYSTLRYANDDADIDTLGDRFDVDSYGYDNITVYTPGNLDLCEYADKVLRLNGKNLKPKDIIDYIPGDLNNTEIGLIYEAVNEIVNDRKDYTIADVMREIRSLKSNTKWGVVNKIEPLATSEFLSDRPTPLTELFVKGRASIIDMKGIHPDVQQIIVAKLLSGLFEARKQGLVPPGIIVVEEAHNFCPEKGFLKTTSSEVLRTIASEGRKFGIGLMIISQRPAKVDKNVLSQCSTQIIMRVTNPNDLKAITKSLEGMTSELEEEIKRLPPGVALIVSPDISRPVLVEIRVRRSKHGGGSEDVSPDDEPDFEVEDELEPEVKAPINMRREETPETRKGFTESLFQKVFGRR